jgi:hypothetical protein
MAIPGITYRLENGTIALTHQQMDDNFRSVVYSSSIHDGGDTLRLHFDTNANDYYTIPLAGGTGGLTITGNINNNIVTGTGTAGLIQGESNFTFDGTVVTITGRVSQDDGDNNVFIGLEAGDTIDGATQNVGIGYQSSKNLTGDYNVSLGYGSLESALNSSNTVALGFSSLRNLTTGNSNVSIGANSGTNLTDGAGNVHLGNGAGPGSSTSESNKLYINNQASNTPLILGDFSTGQVTFNSQVSASIFSGSFVGDGSGLTGLSTAAEWDGTLDGDAQITGSLTVSGSSVKVDFTNTLAISGSIFSGSFVGDGSGLTGITATSEWDGTRNGNAEITGSFIVSGSTPTITLSGPTTIDTNIKIHNHVNTSIGIGQNTFCDTGVTSTAANSIGIGSFAGCSSPGACSISIGFRAGTTIGNCSVSVGHLANTVNFGNRNTAIGALTLTGFGSGQFNSAVGTCALNGVTYGNANTAVGDSSLKSITTGINNTSIGYSSLSGLAGTRNNNTAIGAFAGSTANGSSNVFIGINSGPAVFNTSVDNRLYVNNAASDTPLILGNFSTGQVTFNSQVSASVFSGSFYGNGANITDVEWDGSRNGNAEITGSFTVSGSNVKVDFTNTTAISGSIFSGSFVGDGSGLTGIETQWDGLRNGNAQITGSLIVSGALTALSPISIASQGYSGSPGVELIHYHASGLSGVNNIHTFSINPTTGYTGFKADYTLNTSNESLKKVGTLLGSWDAAGNSTINDAHTFAEGNITTTSFSIDASTTTSAILKLDASAGTYNINILITAFKKQI